MKAVVVEDSLLARDGLGLAGFRRSHSDNLGEACS